MKKFLSFAILAFLATATFAQLKKVPYRGAFAPAPVTPWTDKWANFDPQNTVYPSTTSATARSIGRPANTATPAGAQIKSNTTWYKDTTYELCGLVYVTNGATLTIQPGTVIRGSLAYANSSLVVCKGAKLMAQGTPDSAIVFTSNAPIGSRGPGNWGGIILLGRASYNGVSASTSPVVSTNGISYIEGLTETGGVFPSTVATGASTEFGGGNAANDNDTSGILKYVRIEYGGYIFSQNKEINGLTFGAVGRGTTIDYVQASFTNDDAFEWFGGTVNCSHLISYRTIDDEFDSDNGFSGVVQFCLGVRDPQLGDNTYAQGSGGSTSEGYESDNDANGSTNNPRTKAIFSNMTNIGPLRGNNSASNLATIYPAFNNAARIRRYSEIKIVNSILSDYPFGVDFDNGKGNVQKRMFDGYGKFKNNIVSGCKAGQFYIKEGNDTNFVVKTFFTSNSNDTTTTGATYLTLPYGTATYPNAATFTNADYRPLANGLAATGADFSDTTFTMYSWTADTCLAPSTPGSITGSSSIVSISDTSKSFSITLDNAVSVYAWTLTGTGNRIVSGQGTNAVSVVVKNPGTISITGTNFCAVSAASSLAITCTTPNAPTEIRGDVSISGGADTLSYFGVASASGVSHIWTVTGNGNYIKSGQGTDSIVAVTKNTGTVAVVSSIGCATSSSISVTTLCNKAVIPTSAISGTKNIISCVNAIQQYSVTATPGYTYSWSVNGTGNGYGGSINSIGDTVNIAMVAVGTITCTANTGCQLVTPVTLSVVKTAIVTTAPTITAVAILNCGARVYRYNSGTTTPVGVNSFNWSFKGTLANSATKLRDSANGRYVWYQFSNDSAAVAGDSIVVTYNLDCGVVSSAKSIKLSNTLLTAPAIPASITATAVVSNVCGARVYRYAAPAIPTSTTTPAITGYEWSSPTGSALATSATKLRDSANGRYIWYSFSNNSAAASVDSIRVCYIYNCGKTRNKALKLALTVLNPPAAPALITITKITDSLCGQPRYRYAATSIIAATTTAGAATGHDWSFYGNLGSIFVVDSGSLTSRVVTGYYPNTSAKALGDSVKCRYTSVCGNGAYKVAGLTNTASSQNVPATPASITATLVSDVCGARVYRYAAPVLPAGTATNVAPTGYEWSLPTGSAVALSGIKDSGELSGSNARFIRVIYTNNGLAITGDSIRVRYTSPCGVSAKKALKLTNIAITCSGNTPLITKATIKIVSTEKTMLYPNPNNGIFTLNVTTGNFENAKATIQVVDIMGKVVYQTNEVVNNGTLVSRINNYNLSTGIYTVRYTIGSVTKAVKMVVQK